MPAIGKVTDTLAVIDATIAAHHDLFPAWSRDVLLCHPTSAIVLCREVRRRLHRPTLKDVEILWTWLNAHKRGVIEAKKGRGK